MLISKIKAWWVAPLLFTVSIPSVYILSGLSFEYNIESFFSGNDPEVIAYQQFKSEFGNENNSILIGIDNGKVVDKEFLSQIAILSEELNNHPWVADVQSIDRVSYKIKVPIIGFISRKLIRTDSDITVSEDIGSMLSRNSPFKGLISEDGSAVQIVVEYKPDLTRTESEAFLKFIHSTVEEKNFHVFHLAGRLVTQDYFVSQMKSEMKWFGLISVFTFIMALSYFIRSFFLVVGALVTIVLSNLFTFALIAMSGYKVELMITLIPAIVVITGTSLFVHLAAKFRQSRGFQRTIDDRIYYTLKEGLLPAGLSLLTTIAGFASLAFVPILPIRLFGLFTAFGILITGIISLLILIPVFKKNVVRDREINTRIADRSNSRNGALKMLVVIVFLILGVISVFQVQSGNNFLDDLSEDNSLKTSLNFFEKKFSGIRPVEILIKGDPDPFSSLNKLEALEDKLAEIYETKISVSPASIYKFTNQCLHGGNYKAYRIPEDTDEFQSLHKTVEKYDLLNKSTKLFSESQNVYRISFRTKDLGSSYHFQRIEEVKKFVAGQYPETELRMTGVANLIDEMNRGLTSQLMQGLIISFILITLCLWLITRSIKMALLSLIPNIIPLLAMTIVMWLFDVPLKVGTATVFTIVLGLAVDDTIHFLVGYGINKKKFRSTLEALHQTISEYKRPILHSSLILAFGFFIFSFSEFFSISYLGMIVSFALLLAYYCDIYLLPSIILFFDKKSHIENHSRFRKIFLSGFKNADVRIETFKEL
ncbi:MAG: MMPL family transporter [Bacteroidetes bacterium]|nr:MMPL family transporter [Bacteroidota bacterium]